MTVAKIPLFQGIFEGLKIIIGVAFILFLIPLGWLTIRLGQEKRLDAILKRLEKRP